MSTPFNKPEEVLAVWLRGVNGGAIAEVASLYSPHAVLLPTFSNKSLIDSKEITKYFERLAERKGLSVELHEKTLVVREFSADLYAMSGLYCWRFEVEGEARNFEARFTFVVDMSIKAPIVHQHSSQIPRML